MQLSEQEIVRREKLRQLRELGIGSVLLIPGTKTLRVQMRWFTRTGGSVTTLLLLDLGLLTATRRWTFGSVTGQMERGRLMV